jgi:hypothetical protein
MATDKLVIQVCPDCQEKLLDNDEVWMGIVKIDDKEYSLYIKFVKGSENCGTFNRGPIDK